MVKTDYTLIYQLVLLISFQNNIVLIVLQHVYNFNKKINVTINFFKYQFF
jgi:hypothetical protein